MALFWVLQGARVAYGGVPPPLGKNFSPARGGGGPRHFWVLQGARVAYGGLRLPWVKNFAPAGDAECPRISLIFAARDEEEKLPIALATLAALDYPQLEIIGVDDRSQDATGRLLDEFA